jgi:hypothetical protein
MTGDEVGNVVTGETMGEIEDLTRGPRYFKNIDEVLPNFDPVKEDISVNQWIDKIEEYAEIYDWDDLAIRHFGLSKLCGVARAWRDSLPRQERKWQDWCRLLRENFPCQENRMAITLDAQNYKRKSGQHIVEYFYEKLARCNKAAMSEQETIEWIVHGLNNNKFRDHLGPLSRYKRPSELLPDIKSASNYISDTKDKVFGKHFVSGNDKTNTRGIPKCYQCGKEGHIARNCFSNKNKSVTCFKCSKIGHYAKDCGRFRETQSKSAVSSSSTEGIKVLQIGSDTHRKYFKDALINGRPTKCYIDLGSSCVTIRLDLVEQMGYTYFETDLEPLVGYGQGVVKPIGMLTVDLTIDDVTAKVNAHVVPNDSQLVPVLVGHPYTEQPHVCIISTSDELMVRNGLSDFFNVNEANDKKTHISSSKQVTIPSNYLGHVSICSTVVNETLCIEGGMRENGHVIPRCVIEVDNEGKSALPVLNLSNKPLVFKEGDRITRGEISKIAEVDGKREINDEPISYEDIHTDLLEEDASVLLDMLNENKGLIAKNLRQIGLTNKIEMKIDLKDETPVYYRSYRMAITEKQQVKKIVEELKDADIIEDSNSPFASPVLLVKKKTGDLRMCIDYRALNKQTVKDHYSIPLIDDQLDRMCKMKYFTSLDLRSGYYQVPINKHCRKKAAFVKTLLHLGIDKTLKPLKIISDRGTAFTSDCFKTFCDLFGIQHVKIASSTPRANGQMERMNKIITSCLATSVESEESNDWDEKLFQVQWAINSSVHSVTKRSPNEIVFSYKGFGLEENPLTQEIIQLNSEIQFNDKAEEEEIQSLLRKNQEKMKTQFDKKRREPPTYSEKDLVMVRCEAPSTGQSRKLTAKYRGPYEVVKALDNDRYLVQDIEGEQQSARIYKGILPVDRLKLVPKSE